MATAQQRRKCGEKKWVELLTLNPNPAIYIKNTKAAEKSKVIPEFF